MQIELLFERHDDLARKLARQDHLLERIENRIVHMSAALDRLTTEVADTKAAAASIIEVVTNLQAQLAAGGTDDSDALNKLADDLAQAKAEILAAIAPATPAPAPVPDDSVSSVGQNS